MPRYVSVTPTLRLGRIFGIEVGFNWSLVFVFVLIAWSLASSLPSQVPGRSDSAYWFAGLSAAVLFYACLLAHELAHSLVARSFGLRVSGITLWLFGGVSQLEDDPQHARSQALISIVGPLTSLAIAAIAYALAAVTSAGGSLHLTTAVLGWLAYINLVLGLFNLIPAFPLDGGRLLGSLLWWRSGDHRVGVHQAVLVGRFFAYAMIVLGFVELLAGSAFNGIWIAFMGWFLLSAASAEDRAVQVQG